MKCFVSTLGLLFLCSGASLAQRMDQANQQGQQEQVQFPKSDAFAGAALDYRIIPAANNTFCYDILADGKTLIHQVSAPGLPGLEGFKTKAGAEKVAKIVIEKIRKGEMPPTISIEEMKKAGAL